MLPKHRNWGELWSRLLSSDRDELFDRARQEVSKRLDLARYQLGLRREAELSERKTQRPHFFFEPEQVPALIAMLRERLPKSAEEIVERAEQICAHRFDLLGYTGLDYGKEIDWHCDKVHGKQAPRKPWFKINYLDFAEVGDTKITWELNRHQHLVTLAKAYRITGDQRFAKELLDQWYHWRSQNPYPIGVNWASSLEVGIRSLSWLWTRFLLEGCEAVPETFAADLLEQLAISGRHIERYLSTYFSPNTHLLGEGVALFFIGTLCPELKHAGRWQQRGWEIVLQAADRQVLSDGVHFERSTYYHVYALDFFLHAGLLAARNDLPVPNSFDRTIAKMAEALCVLSQTGNPAMFGDDDGGRVFDPQRNRAEHLLDPLATAAVVFASGDLKSMAGGLREETLWLLGTEGAAQFDQLSSVPFPERSRALAESGLYVMFSSLPVPQQLVINAGAQAQHSRGHQHADILSLQLRVDGRALLIDPGTFEYVGTERDIFRSTAAHNTLSIDRLDQSEPKGPFSWNGLAQGKVEHWICGSNFDLFVGSHDGYQRLPDKPVHRRFVFHRKSRFWLVRDVVEGAGAHYLKLSWHVAPDLVRHASPNPTFLTDDRTLGLGLVWAKDHGWAQAVGRESYSPVYGRKEPATALHLEREARLPAEFVIVLAPVFEARLDLGVLKRLSKAAHAEPAVYAYTVSNGEHRFFFAGARPWEFDGWASDADFVYWHAEDAVMKEIVLCGGSYLDFRGQRVISAKGRTDSCEFQRSEAVEETSSPSQSAELIFWPDDVTQTSAQMAETRRES